MEREMASGQAKAREHYWDTLRAGLMLLGIPYHVALSYMPGSRWIVRSDEGFVGAPQIAEFIHFFRMPAFYVIAGYFAALLLMRRAPGFWLKGRFVRLGVPFVATIVTLVPVMNIACEFSNLPYPEAWSSFANNSSTSGGYWVRHLWFIIVLLYLCTAAAALITIWPRLAQARLNEELDRRIAARLPLALLAIAVVVGLWEGAAVEEFYILGLNTNLLQGILRLDELIIYTPYFALGCMLQRAPAVAAAMGRFSIPVTAAALVMTVISMTLIDGLHPATARFVVALTAIAWTQVLIAAARSALDRPVPAVEKIVQASYVIYLFHLPVICLLVWWGQYVAMPVVLKALMVTAITTAVSYGAWVAMGWSPALSFAFNGTTKRTSLTARPPAASPAREET